MVITAELLLMRIKRDRDKGRSWDDICTELGVTRQAIHQWLSGQTQPSKVVLILEERFNQGSTNTAGDNSSRVGLSSQLKPAPTQPRQVYAVPKGGKKKQESAQ